MNNIMKKYHIITIGCYMNQADSERVSTFLESKAYLSTLSWQEADLVVLLTCGIRQAAEDRAYGLVNQIAKQNPQAQIILSGCLAKREDVKKRLKHQVSLFMPITDLPNLFDLLNSPQEIRLIDSEELREMQGEKYLSIVPKHESIFSAYVPIGNGCNNFCSYCVVPHARGREVYRPAVEIITEVRSLIEERGYKEINLIAQNVNSYESKGINFPKLLKSLIAIEGDFLIRFSSSHPKDLSDELIELIASSEKMANHLHLALQSGDDEILKAMNRKYSAAHFANLVKKIRQTRPGIAISTDVIVGFPGETKEQFSNTLKMFQELSFEMAYISQYSPRPETAAWNLQDDVSPAEKKRREMELDKVLKAGALKANESYLNKELRVLVAGKNSRGVYHGRSSSFKDVKLSNGSLDHLGKFVLVKITSVKNFSLAGDIINLAPKK